MSIQKLIELVKQGNVDTFNEFMQLYSPTEQVQIVSQDNFLLFHLAIASGYVPMFDAVALIIAQQDEYPFNQDLLIEALDARKAEGLKKSLEHNHGEMIDSFMKDEYLNCKCIEVFVDHPQYITSLQDQANANKYIEEVFESACRLSSIKFEAVLKMMPPTLLEQLLISGDPLLQANDPAVFLRLWDLTPLAYREQISATILPRCCINAAKYNQTSLIQAILSQLTAEQSLKCLQHEDYNAFVYASDRGNLELVQLIWKNLPNSINSEALMASNYAAYRWAKRADHIAVVEFIESVVPWDLKEQMHRATGL